MAGCLRAPSQCWLIISQDFLVWGQFRKRYLSHQSLNRHWRSLISDFIQIPWGEWLQLCMNIYKQKSIRCSYLGMLWLQQIHDDVIKWKHVPRYWPFVRGIHRWPVDSLHKSHWHGALMYSVICAWTNNWANNRDAGDLRRHWAHYDVIVTQMLSWELRYSWGRADRRCSNYIWVFTKFIAF